MNNYIKYISIAFTTVLCLACTDDDPIEDKVLFTYTSEDPSKAQLILLDTDGNLIDNQSVVDLSAKLTGPSNTERFTIVQVDTTIIGRPVIQIYVNINQEEWNMPSSLRPSKGNVINVNVSSELESQRLLFSGENTEVYANGGTSGVINASEENKLIAIWNEVDQTPKFASYSNLNQNFMDININATDFSEMSYQIISSIPSDAYLYWHLGRNSTSQTSRYDLMDSYSIDVTDGYYYPAGLFDFWYTGFGFRDNDPNESYYTDYYGERPTSVSKMETGDITLVTSLPAYNVKSTNQNIDVILSRYKNNIAELKIYSKNGNNMDYSSLFNSLLDIYPSLELNAYTWEYTWFYEIDGWEYDDFILEQMNSTNYSNDIKSWKYYSRSK